MTNLSLKEQSEFSSMIKDGKTIYAKVIIGVKKDTIAKVTEVAKIGYSYDWKIKKQIFNFDYNTEVYLMVDGKRGFWYKANWCDYMFDYDGPTVYKHDKKNVPITNDMFGNPIELDTVVAFADKNIMCVGVVKRITDVGGVHVKLIKKGMEHWRDRLLSDDEKEEKLYRIPDAGIGTYVIKPDALKELMYHKLVGT